jgi:hypothetical protein
VTESRARSKEQDVTGTAILALTSAGGLLGGAGLLLWAVAKWFAAAKSEPKDKAELSSFFSQLEGSALILGVACLAFVIGTIALIALVRSLLEDVKRARRGPA